MKDLYAYYAKAFINNEYIVPPSVEIDLTNACNQNCIYCNFESKRAGAKDKTTVSDYYRLVDRLSEWGGANGANRIGCVNTITFVGGGEPTLFEGYEDLIDYCIQKKFIVSLITNGSRLNRLSSETAKKMAWIGIDFDAGTEELYCRIRRPKTQGHFEAVNAEARRLSEAGANIDYKVLLVEENNRPEAIRDIFENANKIKARMVYFRLAIVDGKGVEVDEEALNMKKYSEEFGIPYRLNLSRNFTRNYKYCYSMFLLPVFSATGKLCLCCENREEERFVLCNWMKDDFTQIWGSEKHKELVKNVDVQKCVLCRPNSHNISIQEHINCREKLENLFF